MNRVLNAVARIGRAITSIFTGAPDALVAAVETALITAKPYFPYALELSELAAKVFTPGVTLDDAIVAFAKKVNLELNEAGIIVAGRRQGDIIRDLVRYALQKAFPDASTRWLNRAIELAYAKVKP